LESLLANIIWQVVHVQIAKLFNNLFSFISLSQNSDLNFFFSNLSSIQSSDGTLGILWLLKLNISEHSTLVIWSNLNLGAENLSVLFEKGAKFVLSQILWKVFNQEICVFFKISVFISLSA